MTTTEKQFKKQYKKMHKQLIKLAKRFKYFDYIFTLDIFMQCISMIKLAWDNPDVALCQDITAPNNMYKESVEGLSNIKKFFDKYLEAGSRCDICGKEAKTWGHCVCLECYTTPKAKDKQLAIYKRAFELVCENYINIDGISYVIRNDSKDDEDYFNKSDEQIQKETIDYFVSQAKKELEGQDND